jgi:RND family efflux transporter MFP subunit
MSTLSANAVIRDARGFAARGVMLALGVTLVAGGLAWWGIASRASAMTTLASETRELNTPTVSVTRPKTGAPAEELILPGNIQAYTDAPVYARTNGYLRRRLVDMGSRVRAGELLAEIDAPELQHQLQQARADLATAEANMRLAQLTADRYRDLAKTESVTQQDADNASGTLDARKTAAQSARHNVDRLEQLQAFTRITAPFDGIITARNTDVGALIDPGASGGVARELFHIASTNRLRVAVSIPETYSRSIRKGMQASLTLTELPGRKFDATLVRTSEAIDLASRTLQSELEVDNSKGELLPGAYTQVHFQLPRGGATVTLPVTALIIRGDGVKVAVVRNGVVALTPVTLGTDFGTEIEILNGVDASSPVIVSPPDSLLDKQTVRVLTPAAKSAAPDRGARAGAER